MHRSTQLPSLEALKSQAKKLRNALETEGNLVSHSMSLELLATQLGYRDWNTLHAAIGNQPPPQPFSLRQKVTGTYLGQPFHGEVAGIIKHQSTGRYRATFLFDEAINVVRFKGMTNFRKRVSCDLDENGSCADKTLDGVPHFVFDAWNLSQVLIKSPPASYLDLQAVTRQHLANGMLVTHFLTHAKEEAPGKTIRPDVGME